MSDALSQVYAKSLFELAEQSGGRDKIEEVNDELEQIDELMRCDRAFREFLASPIIDKKRRAESLRTIFHGRVTDLLLRFLLVLNEKERLERLDSIIEAYQRLVQEAFGRVEVDLFTPVRLDEDQLGEIAGRVRDALGRTPVIHTYLDPTMIGGLKLRIGDQMIDASLSSRLRRLRGEILSHGGVAVRDRFESIVEPS